MGRPKVWVGKTCLADECERDATCRGLCKKHYSRALRSGSFQRARRPSFAEVARKARADAAITLINAGLLPKTTDPRAVCTALKIDIGDLRGALSGRRAKWDGPRANVDRAEAPPGKKWCSACRSYRKLDEFHHDRHDVDGRGHTCKVCKNRYQKARRRRLRGKAA